MSSGDNEMFVHQAGIDIDGFSSEDSGKSNQDKSGNADKGSLTSRQNGNKVKHMVENYERKLE